MTRTPRTLALLAAGVAAVTVAGPALAVDDPRSVSVSLAGAVPDRDFFVEDTAGNTLTKIDLGKGGTQPFRTRVRDADLTGAYGGFDVEAEMTNLYLKDTTKTGGYDFATSIPSSEASLVFPANPLAASGVVFSVVPKLDVSVGVTCADPAVQSLLDIVGVVESLLSPVTKALCDSLKTAADATAAADRTGVVSGVEATVNNTLTALTDLPVALTGAAGGTTSPFTNASFAPGSVAAGLTPTGTATKVPIMSGDPATSAGLLALVQDQVLTPLGAVTTLASADGTGAQTTVAQVLDGLRSASSPALVRAVGDQLASMTDAGDQLGLINLLTATVKDVTTLDLTGIGGQYVGLPTLKAQPTTVPAAGNYGGTLTVTFIQH